MEQVVQGYIAVPKSKMGDADGALRRWANAHAGRYTTQARRKVKRGANDGWQRGGIDIAIRSVANELLPHLQVIQIEACASEDAPEAYYMAHAISWQIRDYDEQLHVLCSVASEDQTEHPWGDDAGASGLQSVIQELKKMSDGTGVSGKPRVVHGRDVSGGYDLSSLGSTVLLMPWTDDDEPDPDMYRMGEDMSDAIARAVLDHGAVRALSRTIDDPETALELNRNTMALYRQRSRDQPGEITFVTSDPDLAREAVANAIDEETQATLATGTHALCNIMLEMASLAGNAEIRMALAPDEADEPVDQEALRRKCDGLKDRLDDALIELAIANEELTTRTRERDEAYVSLGQAPEEAEEQEDDQTRNRRDQVDEWVAGGRFDGLRFLKSATRPMSKIKHERPDAVDIGNALDRINSVAKAWHNTPSRSIGNWKNFFNGLTGWHYSPTESEKTATKHNAERQFQDELKGETLEVYRHLTYHSHGQSCQIYFDVDNDEFIVTYVGPHLPYATAI